MTAAQLFAAGDFNALAALIDTQTEDAKNTRALIVFNVSSLPQTGLVVFRGVMPWRSDKPIPPVQIFEADTRLPLPCRMRAEVNQEQAAFDLRFSAADIPAAGYATYFARYAEAAPNAQLDFDRPPLDCPVIETLCRAGTLPLRFSFSS